jgi:toxin FitB
LWPGAFGIGGGTASCLVRDLPLATLNIKDFSDFVDHDGLRIVGVNER